MAHRIKFKPCKTLLRNHTHWPYNQGNIYLLLDNTSNRKLYVLLTLHKKGPYCALTTYDQIRKSTMLQKYLAYKKNAPTTRNIRRQQQHPIAIAPAKLSTQTVRKSTISG